MVCPSSYESSNRHNALAVTFRRFVDNRPFVEKGFDENEIEPAFAE